MCKWICKNRVFGCKQTIFAYLSVIGGFFVQLTLGTVYTYGNMAPYMLSYMKNNTSPFKKITPGNSMWIFGLSVFGLGLSMSFGGFMVPRIGATLTILIGGWIMSFGIIITFWTIKVHLALVSITYGLIVGLGVGMSYGTIISVPREWFPYNKGLVTGIVISGFGFSPVTLDFVQAYFINMNITDVDIVDTSRVPYSFILMGSVYAAIQLIGSLLIRRPNMSMQATIIKEEFNSETIDTVFIPPERIINIKVFKPQRLIFEKDFWILWLTYTANSVVAILILSLHKIFGQKLNISDLLLTISTALGAVFNGFGRIVWGYLSDKISYKKLMTVLTLSMTIMMGTFYLTHEVGSLHIKDETNRFIMYFIWVLVLHFLLSGNFSIFPIVCTQKFGSQYSVLNYGILFTAYALAGIVTSSTTTPMMTDVMDVTGYLTPFLVGCGLSFFSAVVTQMYRTEEVSNQLIH